MSREVRSFIIAILLCLADAVLTAWLALGSESLTVLSAFFGAVIDLLAVIAAFVAFVVVRLRRKSQSRFAFGIGKLENVISMVIAALMLLGAQHIIFEAIDSIRNPQLVAATMMTVVLFTSYAIVSSAMYLYYRNLVKTHRTPIINSQFALWYSKVCYDIPIAVAIALIYFYQDFAWGMYLDPVASLIGAGFLLYAAWSIGSSSIGDLLDVSLDAYSHEVIDRALRATHFEHQDYVIKSRRSGPDIFVELHLKFNPQMTLKDVSAYSDKVRDAATAVCPAAKVLVVPYTDDSA
jgi:cation diffusion facilitator family transporter